MLALLFRVKITICLGCFLLFCVIKNRQEFVETAFILHDSVDSVSKRGMHSEIECGIPF